VIETEKDFKLPTTVQLSDELERESYKGRNGRTLLRIIGTLAVVVAISIICITFFFSVMRIQGHSMEPVLYERELVLVIKTNEFDSGDLVAFYYNNKILIKRVIGFTGDWVNIDQDGDVYVNGEKKNEPYVLDKCLGNGDVDFPYQVSDNRLFVLGDHRSISSDSRDSMIGTVTEEQIIGKVAFRFWPLSKFTLFN
jgi:signal peptidase I